MVQEQKTPNTNKQAINPETIPSICKNLIFDKRGIFKTVEKGVFNG